MYACQLMVPCVDSALKSTKSSPRLGAVRGQGSGLRVRLRGQPVGYVRAEDVRGAGCGSRPSARSAELAQFARKFLLSSFGSWLWHLDAIISQKDRTPSLSTRSPRVSPFVFRTKRSSRSGHILSTMVRPQSAAVRGNARAGAPGRPQSAPLPSATGPKLLSRAELDEISQRMFDRGAAYAAKRDKLYNDHIARLNGWKVRVEVRPAVYAGEMRYKYMSAPSKLALDEGRTYEEEGKTWRKNVVSEAERRQYIDHFYGEARRKKVGTATPDPPCLALTGGSGPQRAGLARN